MKILIAGGSGFIGKELTELLLGEGHKIIILTRKARQSDGNVSYVKWLEDGDRPVKEIEGTDIVINLAGVSINDGRWTVEHQKQIYESRMVATDELVRMIGELKVKPSVLINASAIGIYPPSLDAVYTEDSLEIADDFLGLTVNDWEKKARSVVQYGIRTVFMRFGVVLGKKGGALPLMALPYKFFAGGTIGSGKQWVSWVHVQDVVRSILFVIENDQIQGPVNVIAPSPKRMKDFGKTIGKVLNRPPWMPVPEFAMKLVLWKKSALILEGQHVLPSVLMKNGFEYLFPSLETALEDLFS